MVLVRLYKLAIPISGGFDSLVCYLYATREAGWKEVDIFLYNVDYGQPYKKAENRALALIVNKLGLDIKKYRVNLLDENNQPTIENEIISARNLMIAYFGACQADVVILSAPKGEYAHLVLDKNPDAYRIMQKVFTELIGRDILVTSMIEHRTKTEWLEWLINQDKKLANWVIETTVSCHGKEPPCCECSPCFWKWCQLMNNGYDWRTFFKYDPSESVIAEQKLSELTHPIEGKTWQVLHYYARKAEVYKAMRIKAIFNK